MFHKKPVQKNVLGNLRKENPPPTGIKLIWDLELNKELETDYFWSIFADFQNIVKPVKLRDLQYRIMTRSLTTNVKRHKWCPEISPLCSFCLSANETLIHLLVLCPKVNNIWLCLERFINHMLNINVVLDAEIILLNDYRGPCKTLICTLIVICKQYIYSTKCLGHELDFYKCVSKISDWYYVEKYIAKNVPSNCKKAIVANEKKWAQLFM